MAALSASEKAEIAKGIRVASTWVSGERQLRLLELAERIEGADADEAAANAVVLADRLDASTEKPRPGHDSVPGEVVNDPPVDAEGNPGAGKGK